jgi:hypothetical protein
MLAHGADPDNLDEETFRKICVMYADGQIGNQAIVETVGKLTAAIYNYLREPNKPPYKLPDIIGSRFYEYIYPSQNNTRSASEALIAYMTSAKGFSPDKLKGG